MALFTKYQMPAGNGQRLEGFPRYSELLGRDIKKFLMANLFTLLGFLPFVAGTLAAILTSSILVLLPSCILGGAIAGPSLACMYDAIFRSFRDAPGNASDNYKRAFRQNWKQSIIPGMAFCLLLGFYAFMLMLFWWSARFPGFGTVAVYICALVLVTMFFSVYWPQVVLFEQAGTKRFKNCLLFLIRFFWKVFGCALLQLLYWAVMILFLPVSALLLPFAGVWFILFSANFLLYETFDEAFHIEEGIAQAFPEQVAFYEDDEAWIKRKQAEKRHGDVR